MKTIPVLLNFEQDSEIGFLNIDETKLPSVPNFLFALGYKALEMDLSTGDVSKYELVCVSVVQDAQYLKYLNK